MDQTTLAGLVALGVTLFLQMTKDHVNMPKAFLPILAVLAGGIAAGITSFTTQPDGISLPDVGVGAVIPGGIHTLLRGSVIGDVFKAIGGVLLRKPASPA